MPDRRPDAAEGGPSAAGAFDEHPLRRELAAEVHARPAVQIRGPSLVTGLAFTDAPMAEALAWVRRVADDLGQVLPAGDPAHAVLVDGTLSIKWERHGEFVSLALVQPVGDPAAALSLSRFPSALAALRPAWRVALPGRLIAATDLMLRPHEGATPVTDCDRWLAPDATSGAHVLDGSATLFTDFTLSQDGRTRWLVYDHGMGVTQRSRLVQRLLEIEIYRMMALLALPVARAAFGDLSRLEARLTGITAAASVTQAPAAAAHGADSGGASPAALRAQADDRLAARADEDRRLLDELTALAADVERSIAACAFRFPASQAYWDLVRARVGELREQRIGDLRTLTGFLSRRIAPAMQSVAAAGKRQADLSARVERAGAMLRTRVEIVREEQNLRLLAAMDGTVRQQLRLQQTVEGLSVAAITYYTVALLGYLAKPLGLWLPVDETWVMAAAVPLVAWGVWRGVHRVKAALGGR